ncbi:MAG TPA: hypothetical protein VND87_19965 [Stellaceae bacterium]|nr:hypothetical protein [Stellaceae bacterium]
MKEMNSVNPSPSAAEAAETDALYEMANLYPRTTGLPMTVWVGPRGTTCGSRSTWRTATR